MERPGLTEGVGSVEGFLVRANRLGIVGTMRSLVKNERALRKEKLMPLQEPERVLAARDKGGPRCPGCLLENSLD
jgi:hypothetical protein